jgi:predicted amidohydrolase
MNLGYIQFEPRWGDIAANLETMERLIVSVDADLLVLPELAISGYTFTSRSEAADLSESFATSPSLDRLQNLAVKRNTNLVVGFPEKAGDMIFNSAALLRGDGSRSCYRKIHLFAAENEWFNPGDNPFEVHDIEGVSVGIIICFDWFFPESVRVLALKGADIVCQPANLVLPWCQRSMVTRSVENRVFTVTANRVGAEARGPYSYTFTGMSQVTAPDGSVLASAPVEGESAMVVSIDPSRARNKRLNDWNDLFGSRRPSFYSELVKPSTDALNSKE